MEINLVTIEQVKENPELIIIEKYLPFAFKKKMIEEILDTCLSIDENGLLHIDSLLKTMAFEYSIVTQYTNINLSEANTIETYDILKENGIIDKVIKEIGNDELRYIEMNLNEQIDYLLKINNSVENLVAKGITKVANSLPDKKGWSKLIKEIFKGINNINPDKLKFIKQAIDWNNGIDKGK